jgi:hypothetical protein
MGQGPKSRADVEESPSRFPKWTHSSCLQCVVGRCHAEESPHVVDPGVFAGLLPLDGEVPLKQFIMDNALHIPPDAQHVRPERQVPLI